MRRMLPTLLLCLAIMISSRLPGVAQSIHEAAGQGNISVVNRLLRSNPQLVNSRDKLGRSPLHYAVWENRLAMAQYLVTKGADINFRAGFDVTPLHWAIERGHTSIAQWLIATGADVNAVRTEANSTPLIQVAETGNLALARLLIARGADVNAKRKDGWTALNFAAMRGDFNMAQLLLSHGADVNGKRDDGESPLADAASNGRLEVTKLLIAHGAPVNSRSKIGNTPLHWAADAGYPDVVATLVASGADVNAERTESNGWTPLHFAAWKSHVDVIQALVKSRANLESRNKEGYTPLHLAAQYGKTDSALWLIASGADIDLPDAEGNTPLIVAAANNQIATGNTLIGAGADLFAANRAGRTALAEAARADKKEFVRLIDRYLADLKERAVRDAGRKANGLLFRPRYADWSEPNAQTKTVYSNDFESGFVGPEWSTAPLPGAQQAPLRISTTPAGKRRFLGDFGSQTARLSLKDLPEHREISVSFDLYVLRSWDGNDGNVGPDIWSLSMVDGPTLLQTTFANFCAVLSPRIRLQAYPGEYAGDHYPLQTGAMETNSLGYTFPVAGKMVPMDAVYRLNYTFAHTGKLLFLDFAARGLQELSDESWGIDNVQVSVPVAAPVAAHPAASTINRPRHTPTRPTTKPARSSGTARKAAAKPGGGKRVKPPAKSGKRLHPLKPPPKP
jgi:ankyrin repeat protein